MNHPSPGRSGYFMDISDNNPLPDLDAYRAAGHHYLAVKISEGTGYFWPEAPAIIDGWHKRGGSIIGYHWLRPDEGTPAQQLAFYFAHFSPHFAAGDRTMNDWERSTVYSTGKTAHEPPPPEWAAEAAAFNDGCQAKHGAHTLYTGDWYLEEGQPLITEARRWPVILSDYTGGDGAPANPFGLKIWARQFTDRAVVPGMSRPVDYNHILNPALSDTEVPLTPEDKKWIEAQIAQSQEFQRRLFEAHITGEAQGVHANHKEFPTIVPADPDHTTAARLANLNKRITALEAKK